MICEKKSDIFFSYSYVNKKKILLFITKFQSHPYTSQFSTVIRISAIPRVQLDGESLDPQAQVVMEDSSLNI